MEPHKIYSNKTYQSKAKEIAFNSLFNILPINFSWVDKNGYILGCNQHVLDTLCVSSFSEILGRSVSEIISEIAWKNTKKVIATGEPVIAEEKHLKKDGTKLYFLSIKNPIKDCQDNIIGSVNIAFDITDRKLMEMSLRQLKEAAELANQAKTDFLVNMRHDLKIPLSGIVTISEFLGNQETELSKKTYLKEIKECAESILNNLNEILNNIKTENDCLPIVEKEFNIHLVLKDIYRMLSPIAHAKGIEFTLTISLIPSVFIGDMIRTQKILLNIISNAIKFTETGFVKVSINWFPLTNGNGTFQCIVEDSGIGIHEKNKNKIFEKFTRLNPSYEDVYSGSGLGLYLVKQYVEYLKGNYEVESTLGKGTRFLVNLPMTAPDVQIQYNTNTDLVVEPEKLKPVYKSRRILLVEDNAIISHVCKAMLETLNCTVDVAPNGKTAIELFTQSESEYDLILMDIGLPDISGYKVTEEIRKHNKTVPIIAVTGHSEPEDEIKCIEIGMNRMISKPFTKEIAETVLSKLS